MGDEIGKLIREEKRELKSAERCNCIWEQLRAQERARDLREMREKKTSTLIAEEEQE